MLIPHIAAALILIALPIRSVIDYRALQRTADSRLKVKSYVWLLIMLWSITAIIALEYGPDVLFRFPDELPLIRPSAALTAAVTFYFVLNTLLPFLFGLHPKFRETLAEAYRSRSFLFPVSTWEKRVFIALALSVGVCEEVIFRAFLPLYLQSPPFGFTYNTAFVAASVLFGLSHFLQGVSGIVHTTVVGLLFGYLYGSTGNLLLPIALHALFDLRIVLIGHLYHSRNETKHPPQQP